MFTYFSLKFSHYTVLEAKCVENWKSEIYWWAHHPVSQQAWQCCFMSNQSEAASVLCKAIGKKLWPISEHRENCNSLSECYLHISKYHLEHRRHSTSFHGVCRNYADFQCMVPILHWFRLVGCNWHAALYSAQFNYILHLYSGGLPKISS